ncbi:MAG: glycosyltransferase family 61 protein, partial [Proteobacteria bacterium]|nr:glycosyltransferase family 61 protein [Pseudomonadota bacterium]
MVKPTILPFLTEDAYIDWLGAERRVLYPAETRTDGPPMTVPPADAAYFGDAPMRYDFPAVTVTPLRHVVVRGKSNLLTPPEAVLRHPLLDLDLEVSPEEFYTRLTIIRDIEAAVWSPNDPFAVDYLPEAAVFTDGVGFNYAHWLTEVLPRIAAFVRDAPPSVPLIIDSDLHANILRSVALIAPEARLYRLAPGELVRVGVLHKVSVTGYVPFKLRPQPLETIRHGLFGGQALRGAAAQLRQAVPDASASMGKRPRLLLRRTAALRRLVNEAAVEEVL